MAQRRNLFPRQRQHPDRTQGRKEVAVHRMPALHLGTRLAVQGDVFHQKPLSQLRHGAFGLGAMAFDNRRVRPVPDVASILPF